MNIHRNTPVFAVMATAFLLSFNGAFAAEKDAVKENGPDARFNALENKIELLEKRIKELEGQLTERVTPLNRLGNGLGNGAFPGPGMNGINEMFEQLQKEMMNGGFDRFTMPNTPNWPGPRGGFNRVPGRKPRLGVELDMVRDELKTQFKNEVKEGAFVMSIVGGSPAEKAGLQVGDAITSFDGKPVSDPQSLIEAVKNAATGSREIIVSRHGESLALKVELGKDLNDQAEEQALNLNDDGWLRNGPPDGGNTQTQTELKVSALELNDTIAKDLKLSDDQKKKASEILAKNQKNLSDEFAAKNNVKKKSRNGGMQIVIGGNLNELAQKHADVAAKELASVFNDEQMKKWNDYRQSHNSVSFSQSTKTEAFGGPIGRKQLRPIQPNDDNADAKF